MKRTCVLVALAISAVVVVDAQSKFDAMSRCIVNSYSRLQSNPRSKVQVKDANSNPDNTEAFVALEEGYGAEALEALGLDVCAVAGNVVVVAGTMDDIASLEAYDFVRAISLSKKLGVQLDHSRRITGVDDIHAGIGLERGYTGKGVIAALYDSGIDLQHAAFVNPDGTSRATRVWVHKNDEFKSYTTPDEVATFKTDNSYDFHGTHVLGCLAGSYKGVGGRVAYMDNGVAVGSSTIANPYYGMAPDAEIVVGCGDLYETGVARILGNIVNYIEDSGKPAVINLSMGGNVGPHDGSDLFGQMLSEYGKKAIICVSAGNEGDKAISIDTTFTVENNRVATFYSTSNKQPLQGIVEIWSDSDQEFIITPLIYDKVSGEEAFRYSVEGETYFAIASSTINPDEENIDIVSDPVFDSAFDSESFIIVSTSKNTDSNNRYNATLMVALSNAPGNKAQKVFGFEITGAAGQRIMINYENVGMGGELSSLGVEGYTSANSSFSINNMACCDNVISVGSYNGRNTYPIIGSDQTDDNAELRKFYNIMAYAEGDVSNFSSYGVRYDGQSLPDVCAPGLCIVSSMSKYYKGLNYHSKNDQMTAAQSFNDRDNHWAVESGTSMASPMVAGAIALWLEADPTLSIDDVKDIIGRTADSSSITSENAVRWGAGKFDALAGLKAVFELNSVGDVLVDNDDKLILTSTSQNVWQLVVPHADNIDACVYTVAGQLVTKASTSGSELTIDASSLSKGIYVINVNGTDNTRIVVR